MTVTTQPASTPRRRALGVVAAVAACVLIWVIATLAGVDWTVRSPDRQAEELGLSAIIVVALGASLLGWAALAALERFAGRRAVLIWTILAVAVSLVSLLPLFSVEATTGAKLALGAMHLAVAAVLVPILPARR